LHLTLEIEVKVARWGEDSVVLPESGVFQDIPKWRQKCFSPGRWWAEKKCASIEVKEDKSAD